MAPDPDQEICLCFHVTRRKIESFIRHERPKRVGQLAECFGAGTGCGWCRRWLRELFQANEASGEDNFESVELPDPEDYASQRRAFRAVGGNQPESPS